jgi:hypothetical protein
VLLAALLSNMMVLCLFGWNLDQASTTLCSNFKAALVAPAAPTLMITPAIWVGVVFQHTLVGL